MIKRKRYYILDVLAILTFLFVLYLENIARPLRIYKEYLIDYIQLIAFIIISWIFIRFISMMTIKLIFKNSNYFFLCFRFIHNKIMIDKSIDGFASDFNGPIIEESDTLETYQNKLRQFERTVLLILIFVCVLLLVGYFLIHHDLYLICISAILFVLAIKNNTICKNTNYLFYSLYIEQALLQDVHAPAIHQALTQYIYQDDNKDYKKADLLIKKMIWDYNHHTLQREIEFDKWDVDASLYLYAEIILKAMYFEEDAIDKLEELCQTTENSIFLEKLKKTITWMKMHEIDEYASLLPERLRNKIKGSLTL